MGFIGLLRTLEQITRPPRMGHDDDRPLPDYKPVSPDGYYGYAEPNLGADTEPGLTPDELVAVRQLIEERFPRFGEPLREWEQELIQHVSKSSASNETGTGADPAPSPTIVQSAPPPTVDGEGSPADSGIPPSPAGERPTSELLLDGANAIECWIEHRRTPSLKARVLWRSTVAELRARADVFADIEQDK